VYLDLSFILVTIPSWVIFEKNYIYFVGSRRVQRIWIFFG